MKKIYFLAILVCFAAHSYATSYCTPSPTYASAGCSSYGMTISQFFLTGSSGAIADTTHCTGAGYINLTSMSCTLTAGAGYTATIGTATTAYNMSTQVWIDFNGDSTFSSSESVGGLNMFSGSGNTFSLSISSSAPSGTFRMRVVVAYMAMGYSYPTIDPCMSGYAYGEARDYSVTITGGSSGGCTGTPTAGAIGVSVSSGCGSQTLMLSNTGYTTGAGISLQWQSAPSGSSTWTNISGATNAVESFAAPAASTCYQCIVMCSTSGMSAVTAAYCFTVDKIAGHITYNATAPDTQSLKVWLIYHDVTAGTLTAMDSTTTCLDSLMPYYEFNGMGTGNYLVKAQSLDVTSSTVGASGFVPTYGDSSAHWSTATTVSHTAGVIDTQHIYMVYGTVPSGPGFIGGLITSGAGRNTATDVPAVNMLVYLKNTASGIITQTYTDVTGAYSFSGIGTGSYIIYPEVLAYTTTPSAIISITSGTTHVAGINFKQYTGSKTIRPIVSGVPQVAPVGNDIAVSPNPANNQLTISWDSQLMGNADVVIMDLTGRVVYSGTLHLSATTNQSVIDLSTMSNGLYFVKINTGAANYTKKLAIQH